MRAAVLHGKEDVRVGERVIGTQVSGNYFDVLGTRPALGRFFRADEDQVPGERPVVVRNIPAWRDTPRTNALRERIGAPRQVRILLYHGTVTEGSGRSFTLWPSSSQTSTDPADSASAGSPPSEATCWGRPEPGS